MSVDTAELLSEPTNYAVVQLPGREFPGVVIQGDALNEITQDLTRMLRLLETKSLDDLSDELNALREEFSTALANLEQVCTRRRIALPYSRR